MVIHKRKIFTLLVSLLSVCFVFFYAYPLLAYPLHIKDSRGLTISIQARPQRVVSLVPSITEMIFRIGAGDSVKGITYHSTYPPEVNLKQIVGGFLSPSLKAIEKIGPDVIFVCKLHRDVIRNFSNKKCQLIDLETDSLADSYRNILALGKIFHREIRAREIVRQIKNELDLVRKKVRTIPLEQRRRVIRLMGRDTVMTPGDDSFQNEMIRAAGGIPPRLGKKGPVVVITKEEWLKFNPQVIYGCGGDRALTRKLLTKPGWKDVDAVRKGRIFFFPCELTCRASTRVGFFVQWLSANIYRDLFADKRHHVLDEKIFMTRPLHLPIRYVNKAEIAYSHIHDFVNKTLIIDFKKPMQIVSTLEGQRGGIVSVGNHFFPPPCWVIQHDKGLRDIMARIYSVIRKEKKNSSFLLTGVDMDNLAIVHQRYRDMEVYALVTAGVKSNAVRMSADTGRYYEPGTINIIILPNMELTPRAMTRAIISATEAKTAALADLDIRTHENPLTNQATGTGTDNMIVVQGTGVTIDNAGGHSKMGELIARAVYEGVQEAVFKQNGLTMHRNVFQRLEERRLDAFELIANEYPSGSPSKEALVAGLEETLLNPQYASFLEAGMALSDCYQKGLVKDLTSYSLLCHEIAEEVAGQKIDNMIDLVACKDLPPVLKMCLNALLNGVYVRLSISCNEANASLN